MANNTLGFIGLGVMGGRMCANLARKSGCLVLGYDIDASRVAERADAGVVAASGLDEIMAKAEIVFICVPGEPQVRSLCLGDNGLVAHARPGQVIVDMTTATVEIDQAVAAALEDRGASFADAPVARGVPSAEDGTLSITVGAEAAVLQRIRPYLECMGTDISHCGEIGTGQVMKLMNNMMIFQTVSGLCEAMAIATRAGVARERVFEILAKGSADSFALRRHGSYMTSGEYPDTIFPSTYSLKDLRYAIALAEQTGVDAKGARLAEKRLEEVVDRGWGDRYAPVMYRLFESDS